MIKIFGFLLLAYLCGPVCAKTTCAEVPGEQNHPPLSVKGGSICFVQEEILDDETNVPTRLSGISLYYIDNGSLPVRAKGRGLLYDETPGEIIDAFSMNVGCDRKEKIFVIHSFEVRNSLVEKNSSGKFYSVSVFYSYNGALYQDERSSDWFGVGYSWLSDGKKVVYKFPYQSKKDVRRAVDSPFASLMFDEAGIPVRLKSKTHLFDEPNVTGKTRKYLIAGDRAMLERMTAGWCKIDYFGRAKPVHMWLTCDALYVDERARKTNANLR